MTLTNTLDDLINPESSDDILERHLTTLSDLGFTATDWEDGSWILTLLELDADSLADQQKVIKFIAQSGLLDLSTKDWLTLLAKQFFLLTRKPADFAVIRVQVNCAATAGPYTITPGQLWVTTATGLRYNSSNTANETLLTSGSLVLEFRAEKAGSIYNIQLATQIELVTSLPGVTVVLVETFTGSGSAMSVVGTNEETDALLRQRCKGRWASLGLLKTADAWFFLATSISDIDPDFADANPGVKTVRKALVDDTNPDGPGTLRVYLGTDVGGITDPATLTAEDTFLQARLDPCASMTTLGATNDTVSIKATVYCKAAFASAAQSSIDAALRALQADLAIADGDLFATIPPGSVQLDAIAEILLAPEGVVKVPLSSVLLNNTATDYVPAKGHMAVLDYSFTPTRINFVLV